jgi:peptidoglycan/LPS O-acetylase OafA/YrhL
MAKGDSVVSPFLTSVPEEAIIAVVSVLSLAPLFASFMVALQAHAAFFPALHFAEFAVGAYLRIRQSKDDKEKPGFDD